MAHDNVTASDEEGNKKKRKHKKHKKKKRSHRRHRENSNDENGAEQGGADNRGYANDEGDRADSSIYESSSYDKNRAPGSSYDNTKAAVNTLHERRLPGNGSSNDMAAPRSSSYVAGESQYVHVHEERLTRRPTNGKEQMNVFVAPQPGDESEDEPTVVPLEESDSEYENVAIGTVTQTTEL